MIERLMTWLRQKKEPDGTPDTPALFGMSDEAFFVAVLKACPEGARLDLGQDESERWVRECSDWAHRENRDDLEADHYNICRSLVQHIEKLLADHPTELKGLHHVSISAPDGSPLFNSFDNFTIITELHDDIREQLTPKP